MRYSLYNSTNTFSVTAEGWLTHFVLIQYSASLGSSPNSSSGLNKSLVSDRKISH